MKRFLAVLCALALAGSASAQTFNPTIYQLPPTSPQMSDLLPDWQGGAIGQTYKISIAQLATLIGAGGGVTSFNARIGAVTLTSSDVTTALTFVPPSVVGTPTTGDCVEWASATSLEDAGAACSSGGGSGVSSFNTRTGAVTLLSADVTMALTYTPLDSADNLSDLASASTARTNLGVAYGTAAGTVAQGNDSRFAGPTQNSQSAGYTFIATDAGKQIYHPSADTTARTWVIPANASVPYAVGTKIELANDCSAGVITLTITSDTLEFFPAGTTGSRSIAACGQATLTKLTTTEWSIVGVGVT